MHPKKVSAIQRDNFSKNMYQLVSISGLETERGRSQLVAKKLGVAKSSFSLWLRGRRIPSEKWQKKIAELMGLENADDLFSAPKTDKPYEDVVIEDPGTPSPSPSPSQSPDPQRKGKVIAHIEQLVTTPFQIIIDISEPTLKDQTVTVKLLTA